MSTQLIFGRDVQGYNADAPQFSTDIWTATLAAGTAASITVPSSHSKWIMNVTVQPNGWCWVSRTTTAAIPAGGSFATSSSDLAVGTQEFQRTVFAGNVISFITANMTCDVKVSFQYTTI